MSQFTPIQLPQSGPNDVTATIAEWSKQPGQWVQKGEVIGSAETTKSVFDLEASAAGTFWPLAAPGAEVAVGAIIGALGGEHASGAEASAWLAEQDQGQASRRQPLPLPRRRGRSGRRNSRRSRPFCPPSHPEG